MEIGNILIVETCNKRLRKSVYINNYFIRYNLLHETKLNPMLTYRSVMP